MSDIVQPKSRQELYDQIRASSREEMILEEMIRFGFWPEAGESPDDPADEIRRRGEINKKLKALRTEHSRLHNIEALKREARKRRMKESKDKQAATKERHERERVARAAAWVEKKKKDVVWLGAGVSGGLGDKRSDTEKLKSRGLPVLHRPLELAGQMGITLGSLRFLAFSRKTARVSHYIQFKVPKKTGGERLISAPKPRMKTAQYWILHNILDKLDTHGSAHGFRKGRSIVSNAQPHVNAGVVLNCDLKDFFPTVTYKRVKGIFKWLGYSESLSTVFALLCTEPHTEELEFDGVNYYVGTGERRLPQGAPTSPALTNVICLKMDRRLTKAAAKLGFKYTRYADDLTCSATNVPKEKIGRMLRQISWIAGTEGFVVHPKKTRVLHKGRRQEVTGIVVNEKQSVDRRTLKRLRATLYQIEKDGVEGKQWAGRSRNVLASVLGFANYVYMVDKERGAALLEKVHVILKKHGYKPPAGPPRRPKPQTGAQQPTPTQSQPEPAAPADPAATETDDGGTKKKKKKWWKNY